MSKKELFTEHFEKPTVGTPAGNAKPTEVLVKELTSGKPTPAPKK